MKHPNIFGQLEVGDHTVLMVEAIPKGVASFFDYRKFVVETQFPCLYGVLEFSNIREDHCLRASYEQKRF